MDAVGGVGTVDQLRAVESIQDIGGAVSLLCHDNGSHSLHSSNGMAMVTVEKKVPEISKCLKIVLI